MYGDIIKSLRNEKKLSQRELAKDLSIGASTLAMYELEKRQPDYSTLQKIADYFNVSVDYLLGRTDNQNQTISPKETIQKDTNVHTDLNKLVDKFEVYFMDDDVSEEEKERILRKIQDHYWKSRDLNKQKKNKEK